ncbi:unnamed protein product [marine sediment metagenome]|uniref:Uncharacterized protein n=1 Tax=marine sediment metagenome TaxID=412755 RepID=X1DRD5_9ZZZZ
MSARVVLTEQLNVTGELVRLLFTGELNVNGRLTSILIINSSLVILPESFLTIVTLYSSFSNVNGNT